MRTGSCKGSFQMSSKASEAISTSSQNVAMDQRQVLENGTQIRDSIMQNNDPKVITAALGPLLAAWEQQVKSGHLNLVEITGLAEKLTDQVAKSQIQIGKDAQKVLKNGVQMFQGLLKQNKLNVQLVEGIANRSFDQSDRAIDIIADVQTGDFADLSKSIMLFALCALAISAWTVKEK